jgi:hypothetical protein
LKSKSDGRERGLVAANIESETFDFAFHRNQLWNDFIPHKDNTMKMKYLMILLGLLPTFYSQFSIAGSQTAFSYQGRLDDNGAPANGVYDFQFALFDSVTNGNQLGSVVFVSDVTVSNGLFTTAIDFGNAFNGSNYWLDVAVSTNGSDNFTGLIPRQPISPAPSALFANSASNVSGEISSSQISGTIPATQLNGTISFTQLPPSLLTNGASGVNISGTFTGDGSGMTNVNLATVNSGGAITLTTNYFWRDFTATSAPAYATLVTSADVNGDGTLDLICSLAPYNQLTVLTNKGSGEFAMAGAYPASNIPNAVPLCIVATDVNGDAKPDLVSANGNVNTLTVLTNNGSGGFALVNTFPIYDVPYSVTAADVNGDSKPDLITLKHYSNSLIIFTNNGSGGFATARTYGVGTGPEFVTAADVNSDGKVDLVTANTGGNSLTVLTNMDNGDFATNGTYILDNSRHLEPRYIATADINGDGKLDLISLNEAYGLTVFTNANSGFVVASNYFGFSRSSVVAADVNGDGKADLIDNLTIRTNDGTGAFTVAQNLPFDGYSVIAADVNRDDKPDLISANQNQYPVRVFLNQSYVISAPSFAGVFAGDGSQITNLNASKITAGIISSALLPSGLGGINNIISGNSYAVVSGGYNNTAGGQYATIGGGTQNLITGNQATIGGGGHNIASGIGSFIGGGGFNDTLPFQGNSASGVDSVIVGGFGNTNTGDYATIGGGEQNTANEEYTTISGGAFNIAGWLSTVSGGIYNTAGWHATIGGGYSNTATNDFVTVGGGKQNTASSDYATVSGGGYNTAGFLYATVAGGYDNNAYDNAATIGGGIYNTSGYHATVSGGEGNSASGFYATVGGGYTNRATNAYSIVPGGYGNIAGGTNSFAAGYRAQALHSGAFVWADNTGYGTGTTLSSTNANSVTMRAAGGYRLFSNAGTTSGVFLPPNGTAWATISDQNAKKDFSAINTKSVLEKLAAIPVEQWHYKWESDSDTLNIGPMAQAFKSAFYPGRDDKSITTLEFDGVELAAIQGLNHKLDENSQDSNGRIQKLELENAELKQQNGLLEDRLNDLEAEIKLFNGKK